MDRTEAMTTLLAFAKTRADELRANADKDDLNDVDLKANERIAAELDEAARVLAVEEGEHLVAMPSNKACLVLSEGQVAVVDYALTGFAKALMAARDMAVITHDTFCKKADRARGVQFMVWEIAQQFEDARRQRAETAGGDAATQD